MTHDGIIKGGGAYDLSSKIGKFARVFRCYMYNHSSTECNERKKKTHCCLFDDPADSVRGLICFGQSVEHISVMLRPHVHRCVCATGEKHTLYEVLSRVHYQVLSLSGPFYGLAFTLATPSAVESKNGNHTQPVPACEQPDNPHERARRLSLARPRYSPRIHTPATRRTTLHCYLCIVAFDIVVRMPHTILHGSTGQTALDRSVASAWDISMTLASKANI